MADDPKTKQDRPSEGAAAPDEKVAHEAAEAKAAQAQDEAADAAEAPAPKRRRRKTPPKAEATAADETGVGKEEAAAAVAGAETEEKPKRRRAPAEAKEAESAEAVEPAEPAKPAEAAKPVRSRPRPAGERAVVRAQAKYVRTSARKARLVCDHIRGKSVEEARAILAHTPRAVAEDWTKLLESAVANAEHNHELLGDDLRILAVHADEGPTLKRFRPRAMGRATKIRKRTSHLTITLTPKE